MCTDRAPRLWNERSPCRRFEPLSCREGAAFRSDLFSDPAVDDGVVETHGECVLTEHLDFGTNEALVDASSHFHVGKGPHSDRIFSVIQPLTMVLSKHTVNVY